MMETNVAISGDILDMSDQENEEVEPINDIIDYLVRCAKISFINSHKDEREIRTKEKILMACNLFKRSPTDFLMQFGKYLAPYHMEYFEKLQPENEERDCYKECVAKLKSYHSDDSRHKRVRNRRYKAMQKLQEESDYFSEKQMMFRNPLLYEQLVGQYLTDEEIRERDGVDNENLTFLNMILETVDRNQMRETKNVQMVQEDGEINNSDEASDESDGESKYKTKKQWGDFDTPDTVPSFTPEKRKQAMLNAPERDLLRKEFLQEMYSSFLDGRDIEIDYNDIDNDEQFDDMQQVCQDAEDRYFDSETNEVENLEEHMQLREEYGKKKLNTCNTDDDPLDVYMRHIKIKQNVN